MAYTEDDLIDRGLVPYEQSAEIDALNDGLKQTLNHLNELLENPAPRGVLSNWFSRVKAESSKKRIVALADYISSIQDVNTRYIEFQAKLYLNADIVRSIVLGERLRIKGELITAEQAIERQIADHRHYLHALEHERNMRRLAENAAQAEIAMKKAQALAIEFEAQGRLKEAEARAATERARAAREMELVELIKYVRQNINVSELPHEYQAFIMVSQFGSPLDAEKFKIAQELRDWFIRSEKAKAEQAEAQAAHMRAEADRNRTEADYHEYKRQESMKDPDV